MKETKDIVLQTETEGYASKNTSGIIQQRREVRTLRQENGFLKNVIFGLVLFCIVSIGACVIMYKRMQVVERQNETLEEKIQLMESDFIALRTQYELQKAESESMRDLYIQLYDENESNIEKLNTCTTFIENADSIIEDLESQASELYARNQELVDTIYIYEDAVADYEDRLSTYEKYRYAALRENGTRTDVTYYQLKTAEEIMESKGLDPDLLLSILMVESNGKANAKNPTSSARGYGQFLKSTGTFVYEELMNAGKYNHNVMAYDGDTNIKMMAEYLDYIIRNSSSLESAIEWYRGEGGSVLENYISAIDSYLQNNGKSVAELSNQMR